MIHLLSKFAKPSDKNNTLSVLVECDDTERQFIARVEWDRFEDNWRQQASWTGEEDEEILEEYYYSEYNDYIDYLQEYIQDWYNSGNFEPYITLEPYYKPKFICDSHYCTKCKLEDIKQSDIMRSIGFVELDDFSSNTYFIY